MYWVKVRRTIPVPVLTSPFIALFRLSSLVARERFIPPATILKIAQSPSKVRASPHIQFASFVISLIVF